MAELSRVGTEIVVTPASRTITPIDGVLPATAIMANGRTAAVWASQGHIYGSVYQTGNEVASNAFQVSTSPGATAPEILLLSNGNLVVAFQSNSGLAPDGDSTSIHIRMISPAGQPFGDEIVVNTVTAGSQQTPEMAALTNGGFVMHWYGPDGIKAQLFNATGAKVGGEFAVDSPSSEISFALAIPGGGFLFAHVEKVEGQAFLWAVVGQKYDAAGQPVGSEYIIQGLPGGNQQIPPFHVYDAAALSSGGGVIALYADPSNPTGSGDVYGVRLDLNMAGTGLFLVNNNTAGQQVQPQVVAVLGGYFFAWTDQSNQYDPSGSGIVGQLFDNKGNEVGSEILINTKTDLTQQNPELSSRVDSSRIAVVWQDQDAPGSFTHDVRLQLFNSPTALYGPVGTQENDAFHDLNTTNEPTDRPEWFWGLGGDDSLIYTAGWQMIGDKFEGGAGNDRVILRGLLTRGVTFEADMLYGVETVELISAHDTRYVRQGDYYGYGISMQAGNVAPGETLTIDGSTLRYGENIYFYGQTEQFGKFNVIGGAGTDYIFGGQSDDTIRGAADRDYLSGQGGNDTFHYSNVGELVGDTVDGGAGSDRMVFNGAFGSGVVFAAGSVVNIETMVFVSAPAGSLNSYGITTGGGTLTSGQTLVADGSALRSGEGLFFNAGKETAGSFDLRGGASSDYLFGGAGDDVIRGGLANDHLVGNGGADIFSYASVAESTGPAHDYIVGFDYQIDRIDLPVAPPAWSADITGGVLRVGSFDADLAAAVDVGLAPNSAVLFRPNSGEYAGHIIAVVDVNGDGNYQAGQDFVIDFYAPTVPIPPAPAIFV